MALRQFSIRTLRILLFNIRPHKDIQCSRRQCFYNIICACSRRYVGENAGLFGVRLRNIEIISNTICGRNESYTNKSTMEDNVYDDMKLGFCNSSK